MKLNSKVRYGLRTMLEIANSPDGILQKDISLNQSISEKYLDQIIASLKAAGLVIRGATRGEGYKLLKPANEISVYDIYKAFEYEMNISKCESQGVTCPFNDDCKSKSYWCNLNQVIKEHMQSESVEDIIKNSKKNRENLIKS